MTSTFVLGIYASCPALPRQVRRLVTMKGLLLLSFGHAAVASVIQGVAPRNELQTRCGTPDAHYEPNQLMRRANPPVDDGKELVFDLRVRVCCSKAECPTVRVPLHGQPASSGQYGSSADSRLLGWSSQKARRWCQ